MERQTDMRRANDFDDAFKSTRATLRATETTAIIVHHRIVFQMAVDSFVARRARAEVQSFERKITPAMPVLNYFSARHRVAFTYVNRIHREHFFVFDAVAAVAQGLSIYLHPHALLFIGGDPGQSHQMMAALSNHLEAVRIADRGNVNGRMGLLQRLRINPQLRKPIMLSLPFE